jgi:hypothetical protein
MRMLRRSRSRCSMRRVEKASTHSFLLPVIFLTDILPAAERIVVEVTGPVQSGFSAVRLA